MAARFADQERALLLKQRGIGAGTLRRLEAAGYGSIDQLRRDGVAVIIERAAAGLRDKAWANRAQALQSALRAAGGSPGALRPAASVAAHADSDSTCLAVGHLVPAHDAGARPAAEA